MCGFTSYPEQKQRINIAVFLQNVCNLNLQTVVYIVYYVAYLHTVVEGRK